jgi:ubiquinone/menaquinone biosynthesis C-methylase UbiE
MVDVAANFSGSMPEHYDRIMGPAQFEVYAADLVRRLPAKPQGDVLELACGTGIVTRKLRERLDPSVRLVASDISEAMLEYAKQKVQGAIEWRKADAASLPFDKSAFGAVLCAFGVMFVPDKKAAFREARRVLREDGVFLFNVWDGLDANPHSRATNDVIEAMFPGDPEMKFRGPFEFNDRAVLRALLDESRFREVRIEPVRLEVRSPSAREYATGQLKGTPRGALLAKRGVAVDDVIEKIGASLAQVGGEAPFKSSAQALVIEARAV